jgi:hypothetical protein
LIRSHSQIQTIWTPSINTAGGANRLAFRTNPYSDQGETSTANHNLVLAISLDLNAPDPMVTVAISPSAATEDGSSHITYTFSRTGDTSRGLSVYCTMGGTATLSADYTRIAATPASKTLSFAAGAASATVTVNPKVDSRIEPDETVSLTLATGTGTGTGYSIATTAAVDDTILNDDTAINNQANSKRLSRGDGKACVEYGAATRQEISSPWNAPGATTPPASSTPRALIPTGTDNPPLAPTVSSHPRPGIWNPPFRWTPIGTA